MIPPVTSATVLVVDDCPAICDLIEIILGRVGYHVLTATRAPEALRLARHATGIDLLISNVEMPEMRGDELARRFCMLHPATPVVFISSFEGRIEVTGQYEVLPKPFTVAELRGAVSAALRNRPAPVETALVA
ncbi:MAG: response regulator [Chthoniobacter sp.]|nr:response regulator [Chthoniobacter sp.]